MFTGLVWIVDSFVSYTWIVLVCDAHQKTLCLKVRWSRYCNAHIGASVQILTTVNNSEPHKILKCILRTSLDYLSTKSDFSEFSL